MEERKETALTYEIINIILSAKPAKEIRASLGNYHEKDLAAALEQLESASRKKLYRIVGVKKAAQILSFTDYVSAYLEELPPKQASDILTAMDADDAFYALEEIDDEEKKEKLISLMDKASSEDIRLISFYEEDEIGHRMTTNFVTIRDSFSVKEAMRAVVSQAQENDNISTIYVIGENGKYSGAIDLKDLIIARQEVKLETITSHSYPSVYASSKLFETIERLKDYAEDSIPVLNDKDELIGVITSDAVMEAADAEMGDDYAKLAGLIAEEDLNEGLFQSMKKRLPWLILLLGLGMLVSGVVGIFEAVVAQMVIVVSFQSLILDMAGNVGTQSLAVTIRVLVDEAISGREKFKFVLKEMRIGGTNGLLLGALSFLCVGLYLSFVKGIELSFAFMISGCVGTALFAAMLISGLVGTVTPMFFHKLKVDPAVASGPLITTINDLVAVVSYYGLAGLMLKGIHLN